MRFCSSNLKSLQFVLLVAGAVLVAFAALTFIGGRIYSRIAITKFHSSSKTQMATTPVAHNAMESADFSMWSPKRIEQYKATLTEHFNDPLAILKIDKIHVEVPVFEGTDERVLNRGVGRILGTAQMGGSGNIGIAGHRDGFFRGLKDVDVGDTMDLEMASGTQTYVIDSIKLVEKSDTSVLANDSRPAVTLVTCFPFYYVGSAPQRYIVHASLKGNTKGLNEPAKVSVQATASRTKESTK